MSDCLHAWELWDASVRREGLKDVLEYTVYKCTKCGEKKHD